MMSRLDGMKALKAIRDIEKLNGTPLDQRVKIIMATALNDNATVRSAYNEGCQDYVWKPIITDEFIIIMKELGLIV